MTRNPWLNALAASGYIVLITLTMTFVTAGLPKEDTIFAPIVGLSLFTLSAAVMGYIFCYQPAQLYFANKKSAGVKLFLQTTAAFGVLTLVALGLLYSGWNI